MTMLSVGDLAQSFLMRHHSARLQKVISQNSGELASSRVSDVTKKLNGDHSLLISTSRAREMTNGYQSAANDASSRSDAYQKVIGSLNDSSQGLMAQLLAAPLSGEGSKLYVLSEDANTRLEDSLALLNTSFGGKSLLGGTYTGNAAVKDAAILLTTLRQEIAGISDPDTLLQSVKAWFDAPAGFSSVMYQGGPEQNRIAVSAVDRVWSGPTANDQAFRSILASFAIASLINDPILGMNSETRAILAQKTGETMSAAQGEIIALGAKIGITEKRIEAAQARNTDALFAYEKIQAQLVGNDPERNVIELQAAQTNLETLYTVTSRLSQLSLVKLLR